MRIGYLVIGLAVAFSVKCLILPGAVSAIGLLTWLSAFYIDRYFSASSIEAKSIQRLSIIETELKEIKEAQTHVKLSMGIRGIGKQ